MVMKVNPLRVFRVNDLYELYTIKGLGGRVEMGGVPFYPETGIWGAREIIRVEPYQPQLFKRDYKLLLKVGYNRAEADAFSQKLLQNLTVRDWKALVFMVLRKSTDSFSTKVKSYRWYTETLQVANSFIGSLQGDLELQPSLGSELTGLIESQLLNGTVGIEDIGFKAHPFEIDFEEENRISGRNFTYSLFRRSNTFVLEGVPGPMMEEGKPWIEMQEIIPPTYRIRDIAFSLDINRLNHYVKRAPKSLGVTDLSESDFVRLLHKDLDKMTTEDADIVSKYLGQYKFWDRLHSAFTTYRSFNHI